MGRSVNYLNNSEYVIYFTADWINQDENGEYDEFLSQINWNDFYMNLVYDIKNQLNSYYECKRWDNRETNIFLENSLCEIGISEYCELYSLSIRVKFDDYASYKEQAQIENLGKYHAEQIRKTLEKCLINNGAKLLNRLGTFSNGCGVFEHKGNYYDNAEKIL